MKTKLVSAPTAATSWTDFHHSHKKEKALRRTFPNLFSAALIGVLLAFALLMGSCRNGSNRGGTEFNQYLIDCFLTEDGFIVAEIELPIGHFAFLSIDDGVLTHVVNGSGQAILGEESDFKPGVHTVTLELQFLPTAEGFLDLTGTLELCEFEIAFPLEPPVDPPVDPPSEPEPEGPTITCNVNYDGAVAILVRLNGYGKAVILRRVGNAEYDQTVYEDSDIADLPLPPGTYTFQLLDEEWNVLVECVVMIPDPLPPEDEDEEEDPECPPRPDDPRTRYAICYKGKSLYLPWRAMKKLVSKGKATLGPCHCGNDYDEHDD